MAADYNRPDQKAGSAVHRSEKAAPDLSYPPRSLYQGCGLPGALTRNV